MFIRGYFIMSRAVDLGGVDSSICYVAVFWCVIVELGIFMGIAF